MKLISPIQFAEAFRRNEMIVKLQTRGLSDEDGFIQLPFRANCLNWTIGHLLTNRAEILRLLTDEAPGWTEKIARYKRESEPVTGPAAGVLALAELLELLDRSQNEINEALVRVTEDQIEEEIAFIGDTPQSRADWLFFFLFHDSYHTGQTEILRQAAGVNDKVI